MLRSFQQRARVCDFAGLNVELAEIVIRVIISAAQAEEPCGIAPRPTRPSQNAGETLPRFVRAAAEFGFDRTAIFE